MDVICLFHCADVFPNNAEAMVGKTVGTLVHIKLY